jgi:hypothetical protein
MSAVQRYCNPPTTTTTSPGARQRRAILALHPDRLAMHTANGSVPMLTHGDRVRSVRHSLSALLSTGAYPGASSTHQVPWAIVPRIPHGVRGSLPVASRVVNMHAGPVRLPEANQQAGAPGAPLLTSYQEFPRYRQRRAPLRDQIVTDSPKAGCKRLTQSSSRPKYTSTCTI